MEMELVSDMVKLAELCFGKRTDLCHGNGKISVMGKWSILYLEKRG